MLSSLTPVGENSRSQRWWVTVTAFTMGSVLGGAATGMVAGTLGLVVAPEPTIALVVVAAAAAAALAGDMAGITPPSLERQVDRTWMTRYRGWVYGLGYGVQLGCGVATYITSWATWLVVAVMVLVGDLWAAVAIGALHGLVRGLSVWTTASLASPAAIRAHHRRLVALDPPLRWAARAGLLAVAVGAAAVAVSA